MTHYKACPLCSTSEISLYLSCTDHFVTKEVFKICKCDNCGFIFTQDHPDEAESGKYYESDDYISHSNTKKGATDKAYQLVRRIMLNKKKRLIRKITGLSTGSILDIGSGTGHFLNAMKMAGWNVKGVEINARAREYASSQFNAETIAPDKIRSLPAADFDCISLWHVLEHFQEPYRYMEEIARLLKPEGVVIIALPNSNSFDSEYYGGKWAAYDVPRHLWHYNPSTFSIFASKNKFRITGHHYLPYDVFYISILSEKYRRSLFPVLSGIFNGLRFSVRSLSNRYRSSSVIYILRKRSN